MVHFEVACGLNVRAGKHQRGSEDRRRVCFSTCSLLRFMHIELVTSTLRDAKKQGMLRFWYAYALMWR